MKLSDFDFDLPAERIARFPAERRDESRLMVVERESGDISHHRFSDILSFINEDDFMVMNNTKVVPARLFGKAGESLVEVLIVKEIDRTLAEVFAMPARKLTPGKKVLFEEGIEAEVTDIGERGKRILRFNTEMKNVYRAGYAPLPPYIKRKSGEAEKFRNFDLMRYQTLFSKVPGSIAAPTAGLHFSDRLLKKIRAKTKIFEVTLSVGPATFQKIEVENIEDHRMGKEVIHIDKGIAEEMMDLKEKGMSLMAVGTTSVRSLETYASQKIETEDFESEMFIYPGYKFKMVDKLVTNFHLPQSSLFILVSAFAGLKLMKKAYNTAIKEKYRFFSYGDAMLII